MIATNPFTWLRNDRVGGGGTLKKQDFLVDSGMTQHTQQNSWYTERKRWNTAPTALKVVFRKLN